MGDDIYQAIGKRIRSVRSRSGMTQEELATRLKVSTAALGTYERGDRQIGIEYLVQLARIFDCPINWFLGISEELTEDEKDLLRLYRAAGKGTRMLIKLALKED